MSSIKENFDLEFVVINVLVDEVFKVRANRSLVWLKSAGEEQISTML